MRKLAILGMPMDLGQMRRGVDMGPSAIRYAGIFEKLKHLFDEIEDLGDIPVGRPAVEIDEESNLRNLDLIAEKNLILAEKVDNIIQSGAFPLILGGDHSIAIGTLAGMGQHYENLGVIWYDAHGDLNTAETSPSGNIHGMPLAVSLGVGHKLLTELGDVAKVIDGVLNLIENDSLVYQEIQRVANTYFFKHGIYGLDFSNYRKPLNEKQLINLINELIDQLKDNDQEASIIDEAKNYINDHINEPPTLIDVANSIHLNPNYFSDYFKEKTGETFSNYLTRLRMEKAKELLDNPSIKIKEVSNQVGYQDVRNFRKKFKSTVGLTPNEYRKIQH